MDGLSSICAGLGLLDEDENGKIIGYAKGEYCLDNLKDLLRFLRRDDPEKRDVFKQVCKWNTVGKDLIPIIECCQEDRSLVLNAVKVLVFLTMPVEPTSIDIPQQIEYLWGLKSAITFSGIVPVIVSLLESPLENLESESFTEEDWKLVQLVLTLFRNILAIQDISTQQKAGGSATQFISLQDRFLELLFQGNVMELILVLTQHTGGSHGYLRQDNLLLLEIFYYIFKGQDPELIAKTHVKGSKVEEDAENSVTIIKEEKEKRKLIRFHNLSCYSNFTGTFTRVALDGSKALFKGNPSASGDALLKAHKNHRGPSKREIWHHGELPSTKHKILELLKDFISQFVMGGYNVVMQSIRDDIDKEYQEIQSSDVAMFFQVVQFVTSFQYQKCLTSKPSTDVANEESAACLHDNTLFNGSMCGPIAETLNESMFLMVISKWRYAFEGLKQTNDYKFLSAAGSLVKIMIRMLDLVLKRSPDDSKEPQTARILLYKLFYDQTEEGLTQFLLNLIKSFDTQQQSKSDLADLVECMHVILRLLENLQARGTLRVSRKLRKKKKRKSMTKNENVCEQISDKVTTQNATGISTCQESVDVNMLEKETLINQDFDMEADKSRDSIQVDEPAPKAANLGSNESEVDDRNIVDNGGLYLESENSSGDEQQVVTDEVDFKVSSLVSALANNSIIQNLCWLLRFYKSNSITTNHYILSVLRRICDDLELSPMLYQLSLLTIFDDILEEQESRPCKEYENIVNFLRSLVRRMLRKMKSYPLLFVEVLFWKTRKECHYINCGSMLNELNGMKNKLGGGRTRNGEKGLSEGQKWVRRSIADALGDDDFAISSQNIQEENDPYEDELQKFRQSYEKGNESGTSIIDKVIDGSAISDREVHAEEKSDRSSKSGNGLLSDEMDSRLKDLYEKYMDNPHCCRLVAGELDPSPAKEAAKPVSKPETSGTFFNNLSDRIQHGLESGMDLQNLAERVVKSSIHWLRHKFENVNNSEGQESMRNSDDSCNEAIGEKLIELLLRAPKEMKKINQDSASELIVREYEMQILLRLEILRSDISAMMGESRKQKMLKQIRSLLEIIQYLVAGGIHGHVSLYDYVERTIRARYSDELEDIVKEIYARMDLLPFGDDDEAPNLLFNSEDSNQSWRDKHDRKENNSVSTEGESSQPLANTFEEIEKDEHTRNLNEARERRERARRFAPFLGKARDLQRVWAPKNPKSVKCKFDSLPKKSKRKDKQTPSNSVVYETPMTGNKRACFRENNKGDKENSVSKALFQDN